MYEKNECLLNIETIVIDTIPVSWSSSACTSSGHYEPLAHCDFILAFHCWRNQFATALGSNRTQVPIRNDGMRPAAACLKIVTFDTERNFDSSSAVKARPIFSI
jgi:hypothetical protein